MKPPLYVRPITDNEQVALEQGLRSPDTFTLRRCQILLESARGESPRQIAQYLGCTAQTVCNTIHAFEQQGLSCLQAQSSRPKTVQPVLNKDKREQLRSLLHSSPRNYGKSRSTWTLGLLVEVCWEQGITTKRVSDVTLHHALKAMGIRWLRAKGWISSPDTQYSLKKRHRDHLINLARQHPHWAFGFLDQVWWSRLAQPQMHAWAEDTPLRLWERAKDKTDPDPKAIACYGLWLKERDSNAVALCGATSGERDYLCVSGVGVPTVASVRHLSVCSNLGQCHLASIKTSPSMDCCSQPTSQAIGWSAASGLSLTGQESLAQSN